MIFVVCAYYADEHRSDEEAQRGRYKPVASFTTKERAEKEIESIMWELKEPGWEKEDFFIMELSVDAPIVESELPDLVEF